MSRGAAEIHIDWHRVRTRANVVFQRAATSNANLAFPLPAPEENVDIASAALAVCESGDFAANRGAGVGSGCIV